MSINFVVAQDTVQARSLWQEASGEEGIDSHSGKLGQGSLRECTTTPYTLNVICALLAIELGKRVQEMAWQ
jgi:hypothetical protein